jgi:hypothetical protein
MVFLATLCLLGVDEVAFMKRRLLETRRCRIGGGRSNGSQSSRRDTEQLRRESMVECGASGKRTAIFGPIY